MVPFFQHIERIAGVWVMIDDASFQPLTALAVVRAGHAHQRRGVADLAVAADHVFDGTMLHHDCAVVIEASRIRAVMRRNEHVRYPDPTELLTRYMMSEHFAAQHFFKDARQAGEPVRGAATEQWTWLLYVDHKKAADETLWLDAGTGRQLR